MHSISANSALAKILMLPTHSANKLLRSPLKNKANNSNTGLLQHLTMDLPITGVNSISGETLQRA